MVNGPHVPKKKPVRCDWCEVFTSVDKIKPHTPAADVTALDPPEIEMLCELCHRDATKWKIKRPPHVKPSPELPANPDCSG